MPQTKTITIHITEAAGGLVTVLTSAAQPIPGARLSPAEALATDMLAVCNHRARAVHYWQGRDQMLELVRDLVDPEAFGWAVTEEVRRRACRVLGIERAQGAFA
ncbi:hypothetical protein [Melaminivora sp.]|uniref:hypothetical protein n=1 Tax=Melaminivora sp. TaxID=1933032 RepID=UPI0028B0260A|nr:hypothetical protein [Melaminivora sp.]